MHSLIDLFTIFLMSFPVVFSSLSFISTPTLRKNRKSNWHKTPDSLYYKWTTGKSIVLLCLHAINSFAPGKRLLMIWINTLPSPPAFARPSHLSPTYRLISLQINSPKGILPLGFFRLFYFLFDHSNMNPCESNYSRASLNPLSKLVCPMLTVTRDSMSQPKQLLI